MAVHTTLSDSIRRQRSADEQMPFVQEGASRHGADGHANHLAAMMWQWRRPDEMALSRKPLSNGSKTGLLERQFDRVINHAPRDDRERGGNEQVLGPQRVVPTEQFLPVHNNF